MLNNLQKKMENKIEEYNNKKEERIKEKWLEKMIEEVEKVYREHGYYFWRNVK